MYLLYSLAVALAVGGVSLGAIFAVAKILDVIGERSRATTAAVKERRAEDGERSDIEV